MQNRNTEPKNHGIRLRHLPVLAAMALAGQARAATIEKYITGSRDLIDAFAAADADPTNLYKITLEWRRDSFGNTITWEPASTVTLTKGQVYVLGSQSNNYPERYIFDGKGQRPLFAVNAAAGYQPKLTLSGITIRNGYNSTYYGGGLYAYKADDIQIYYCRFLNNKSSLNGSGIAVLETRNFYMLHTLVDGNWNHQIGSCGGGLTAGGGGVAVLSGPNITTNFSMHKSTLSNNKTCRGGGLELWGNINVNMTNNTISNNVAERRGGGILWHGGSGTQHMRFNTIAFNKAGTVGYDGSEPHYGGGVAFWSFNGTLISRGNVIARNVVTNNIKSTLGYTGDDCYKDGGTPSVNTYFNVLGKNSNCTQFGASTAWGIGTEALPFDPVIDVLALGTTNESFAMPVHMPFPKSPLRNGHYVDNTSHTCETRDQRGFWRSSPYCDIGAVEYDGTVNP